MRSFGHNTGIGQTDRIARTISRHAISILHAVGVTIVGSLGSTTNCWLTTIGVVNVAFRGGIIDSHSATGQHSRI